MSKKKAPNLELNHIVASVLVHAEARKTLESNPDLVVDLITAAIPLVGVIDKHAYHLTQSTEFATFVKLLAQTLHCKNTFANGRTR